MNFKRESLFLKCNGREKTRSVNDFVVNIQVNERIRCFMERVKKRNDETTDQVLAHLFFFGSKAQNEVNKTKSFCAKLRHSFFSFVVGSIGTSQAYYFIYPLQQSHFELPLSNESEKKTEKTTIACVGEQREITVFLRDTRGV